MRYYYAICNNIGYIINTGHNDEEYIPMGAILSDIPFETISSLQTTKYILNGALIERPNQNILIDKLEIYANGVDSITITGAIGTFTATTINKQDIQNPPNTITGIINPITPVIFGTTIPGDYEISIVSWPYQDFKTVIKAL